MSDLNRQNGRGSLEKDRLRAMLREDVESPEEAEALLATVLWLKRWPAPQKYDTDQLVQSLLPTLPAAESHTARMRRLFSSSWPVLLLRAQARIVQRELWLVSALMMLLGTGVTMLMSDSQHGGNALTFVWISPIVAAVGVAYLYGFEADPPLEIEMATPASRRLILLARLTLVFGFDLALALAGSVALTLTQTGLSLWPLVMTWFGPMAFLSALAFLLTVLFIDSMAGSVISMLLWMIEGVMRVAPQFRPPLPDMLAADSLPWLLALALLMGLAALWFAGRDERLFQRTE